MGLIQAVLFCFVIFLARCFTGCLGPYLEGVVLIYSNTVIVADYYCTYFICLFSRFYLTACCAMKMCAHGPLLMDT